MPKRLLWSLALGVSLIWAPLAFAQSYTAVLDGMQEVPANGSTATGVATMTLDGAKMLSFSISYGGLLGAETGAHFHGAGGPGVNAGVQFALPPGNPKNGVVGPLSAQQEADLSNGLWYINVHSTLFPGGEIRGQVVSQGVANEDASWGRIKALYP